MPRYTDIDLLIEAIEETDWYHISKQGELVRGANSKDDIPLYKYSDIQEVLNNAPIADVVPTSMVDETTKQFLSLHEKYQEQKVEIEALRGAANSYKMHYENLAREIFEEIEKLSHRFMNDEHYIFGDMVWDIAELKKKYTEGE